MRAYGSANLADAMPDAHSGRGECRRLPSMDPSSPPAVRHPADGRAVTDRDAVLGDGSPCPAFPLLPPLPGSPATSTDRLAHPPGRCESCATGLASRNASAASRPEPRASRPEPGFHRFRSVRQPSRPPAAPPQLSPRTLWRGVNRRDSRFDAAADTATSGIASTHSRIRRLDSQQGRQRYRNGGPDPWRCATSSGTSISDAPVRLGISWAAFRSAGPPWISFAALTRR